jgi:hypothetical protein
MTTEQGQARLASALWESDRHRAALSEALADWAGLRARDAHALENDPVLRRLTDQILYRFMKLQDALGERLVPATWARLLEPCESWSMRDRLDRLEKLGFLDVDPWLARRDVRNRLAQEYPDARELRHAAVLAAIDAASALIGAYDPWKAKLPA